MFVRELSLNTFLGALVLIIVSIGFKTQALKCYVCEDCDSNAPLHELQVCGMPPVASTSGNTGTPTSILPSSGSPAAQPLPATSPDVILTNGNSNESGYDSEEDYENSSEDNGLDQQQSRPAQGGTGIGTTAGIMPVLVNGEVAVGASGAGTGGGAGITAGFSAVSNSTVIGAVPVSTVQNGAMNAASSTVTGTVVNSAASSGVSPTMGIGANGVGESVEFSEEEEEEDDDYQNESRKGHLRKLNDPQQYFPMSVCYTIRLSMNDTIITNRGCTAMLDDNRERTCNSLFDGWNVEGCQLCGSDECNHLTNVFGMSTRFKSSALLLVLSAYSVVYLI